MAAYSFIPINSTIFAKKIRNMILEACVESLKEALNARNSGANRIELCSHLELDGLTPSGDLIRETCAEVGLPVMVMIRPRAGNFIYDEAEIRAMEDEILLAKSNGASGLVFGLLTPDGLVDVGNTQRLAALAKPLPVTFHKAIDELSDPVKGVEQLLQIDGISRILTSGGKATAREGADTIRKMMEMAGHKITILVAGRVTRDNVAEIAELTGAAELHGRRIVGTL
jgi:copper homeostasis protein